MPNNLFIKSAIATNAITNAIMINTNLPALITESPKNEKNGCFSPSSISATTSSSGSKSNGFNIVVTMIALMMFNGIAVNTNSPGIICM